MMEYSLMHILSDDLKLSLSSYGWFDFRVMQGYRVKY